MVKRTDLIVSLIIGEISALLMFVIGRNLGVPSGIRALLRWFPLLFPVVTLVVMAAGTVVGRRLPVAYQFVKFALVGGLNFLIDLGMLNLLIGATGIASGFFAVVFKAIAFLTAVISSFIGNKFWTFRALSVEHAGPLRQGFSEASRQFAGFFVVSVVGLAINVTTFSIFNDIIGPQGGLAPQTWANISAATAVLFVLLWNFLGYKFLVFRREQK